MLLHEQDSSRRLDRSLRAAQIRLTGALGVVAVVVMCSLVLPPVAWSEPVKAWPDLPVHKWTENEVRAHTGGPRLLERELNRQGEFQRRWHQVHDLVGGQHISRKSRDLLNAQGLGPALLTVSV